MNGSRARAERKANPTDRLAKSAQRERLAQATQKQRDALLVEKAKRKAERTDA